MNKKILYGHHGQIGDCFINLPSIKKLNKLGYTIDMPINKKYLDIIPLFLNCEYLNSIIVTDEYEKFPNKKDSDFLKIKDYDDIYNPMIPHKDNGWFGNQHQCSAVMDDYGFGKLHHNECQIKLNKWFDIEKLEKIIAFAPFPGFYAGLNNDKCLKIEKAQEIVDSIISNFGYNVFQVGDPREPTLHNVMINKKLSFFDSVKIVLGCKTLIVGDTGLNWCMSGYEYPLLGLYSHRYYGPQFIKNIQPVNKNSLYLDADNVNNIPLDQIIEKIKLLIN